MKSTVRRALLPVFLLLPLTLADCAGPGVPSIDPRKMSFPPLKVSPPAVERIAMDNGTVLFLLPDREVPVIDIRVRFRAGHVFDPDGLVGLAELTGTVMRTGGAGGISPEEMNTRVEEMGAVLESSIGRNSGGVFVSVLKEDLEEGVDLLARVLRQPEFAEGEVEKARRRKLEQLRRVNDDPDTIAFRQLRPLLYGPDPRGRLSSSTSVSAVTREGMRDYHARYVRPDSLLAGVSGDFEPEEFLRLWQQYFGDWKAENEVPQGPPPPGSEPATGIYAVAKDLPQATVVVAWFAPPKESSAYPAFTVLNYILGGAGFNSRLTEEIRSNRGLAYSVGSFYTAEKGYGVFGAYCRTGIGSTLEAAGLLREVIGKAADRGVTAEELEWARQSILNGLIFSIDSSAEIVSRRMSYEYDGLPPDFLEAYARSIAGLSLEEVNAAAARYLPWTTGPMVVVGGGADLAGALEELGTVTRLPLESF